MEAEAADGVRCESDSELPDLRRIQVLQFLRGQSGAVVLACVPLSVGLGDAERDPACRHQFLYFPGTQLYD